jgi:hypothetical protein
MENFLPLIQTTLTEWLQLTIDHPLYAAVLVITVWIVSALLYSIKIAGLTKKNTVSEQIKIVAETNLNKAQQQLQQAQDQLATDTEQQVQSQKLADTEKQRALIAEQQLIKRNQQIGAIIQNLASSFDIGQRPLPVTEDLKSDDLWQQHDKVIQQLIERLRIEQLAKTELEKFYQAEKEKVAATDAQLASLQAKLVNQDSLATTLQQELTITPIVAVASSIAVEQATPDSSNTKSDDQTAEKLKSLFKKPDQQQLTIAPAQTVTPPVVTVLVENKPSEVKPEPAIESKPVAVEEKFEKPSNVDALKGLYQKFTTAKPEQPLVVPEPQITETVVKIAEQTVAPVEPPKPATVRKFTPTKRLEVKPLSVEPSSRIDEAADLITEKVDKLKGLYGKFFSKSE